MLLPFTTQEQQKLFCLFDSEICIQFILKMPSLKGTIENFALETLPFQLRYQIVEIGNLVASCVKPTEKNINQTILNGLT